MLSYITFIFSSKFFPVCDAPENWQLNLQDPATPAVEGMAFFHDYLNSYMIIIGAVVFFLLIKTYSLFNSETNKTINNFTHNNLLEITWTVLPAFLLLLLAVPSFNLLYSLDELINPTVTLKVIGHQWYWSYEYSDYTHVNINEGVSSESIAYDSYMLNTNDLETNKPFRLLEVDNVVNLPILTHIRVLVTAADVLHSWAIPSFGIKVDACPGRLSQASLYLKRPGVYYGQCSEICGVNHGFMPIVVRGLSKTQYSASILSQIEAI